MAFVDDPDDRAGQPEEEDDDLLDRAAAEQRALNAMSAVNRAENTVANARLAELLAAHEALYRRVTDAEAELEAAEAAGDAAAYAEAHVAYKAASVEFIRVGPGLLTEGQALTREQLNRTDAYFTQSDVAEAALDALAGRGRPEPPGGGTPTFD